MSYLGFWFRSLVKVFAFHLLLIVSLIFSACSYEKDYQVTVCEDRLIDLPMVSSITQGSLSDAALSPVATVDDLILTNFFEEPSAQEIDSLTQLNTNVQIRWQEAEGPISVLEVFCYTNNIGCFDFSSLNETLIAVEVESLGSEEAPQVTLNIQYLNDLSEERYLQATLNFINSEASLNLIEYQCTLNCENSTNSLLAPELIGRICNVDCDNRQSFIFEYQSNVSIFTDRHDEDLAKFFEIFTPNCELNNVSADLLEVSAPFM